MKTFLALGLLALATVANGQFLNDCTNAADGLYALGGCEPQFLTCSGGIARIMDCPADLIYNEPLLICDWRHNVVGCEGSGESSGETSGEGSGETSGEASGEGSGEASGEGSGSGEEEGSGSGEETVENVCEGLEDGAYSSGGCTTYYFFCTSNTARFLSCPTPLFYDAATQKCVWQTLVEECKEEVAVGSGETSGEGSGESSGEGSGENSGEGSGEFEPTCDGKADGIYANGVCSTNFLTCSGGIARLMNCPASLVFNPSILVCDWPRDVAECSELPTPKPVCENDGYYSFGQCSSSFTACTNGRAIVMFCPAGLKFSFDTQRCDYDENVTECQGNSGEESGESSGEQSGEGSGEASGETSGETSGEGSGQEQNECVGLDNGLHAIGCSPRVLSCQNGHVDIFECPSSLVFNEQTLICDYPQTSLKCLIEDTLLIDEKPISAFDCSTDGLFSDGLCSSTYHQCTSGQLINFTCAESNAVFSAANAECVDSSTLLQCH